MMDSGVCDVVTFLRENGAVGFLKGLLGGCLSDETLYAVLLAFNRLIEMMKGPVEEVDSILEMLNPLTESVDRRVADLAHLAQDRITVLAAVD
jgi:hypothetical protein